MTSSYKVLLDRKWSKINSPIPSVQWAHGFTKHWSWSCSDFKECAFFLEAWKYALQLFLSTVCLSPPPPPCNVCISNHTLTRICSILSLLTMQPPAWYVQTSNQMQRPSCAILSQERSIDFGKSGHSLGSSISCKNCTEKLYPPAVPTLFY